MHVPYFLSSESLSNLSSALQKVAEIIIAYPIKIEKMSISELATASGVSPATVTKFCRTLGFDDFNSFKLEIAKFNARISFLHKEEEADSMEGRIHRSFVRSVRVLEQTRSSVELEAFQAAAEAIEKADRVVCFGVGGSGVVASDVRFRFLRLGLHAVAYADSHIQLWSTTTLGKLDVVLAVSHSGRTAETIEALMLAKSSGSKTIALTSNRYSPLAKQADICLLSTFDETPFVDGSVLARISQLGIIDALAEELATRNPGYRERAERVTSAIQARKK